MFLKSLLAAGPGTSLEAEGAMWGHLLMTEAGESPGNQEHPPPPRPGPHRVVSWLMLVKDELLKELILLLLRSWKRQKKKKSIII